MNNVDRIFLGGTCAKTVWREQLIPLLKCEYFNPVVVDWTEECIEIEENEKEHKCNIHLYVITSAMQGVYSIAEIVDSAHRSDKKTFFVLIEEGFDKAQLKSLKAVGSLIMKHKNASLAYMKVLKIEQLAEFINEYFQEGRPD